MACSWLSFSNFFCLSSLPISSLIGTSKFEHSINSYCHTLKSHTSRNCLTPDMKMGSRSGSNPIARSQIVASGPTQSGEFSHVIKSGTQGGNKDRRGSRRDDDCEICRLKSSVLFDSIWESWVCVCVSPERACTWNQENTKLGAEMTLGWPSVLDFYDLRWSFQSWWQFWGYLTGTSSK